MANNVYQTLINPRYEWHHPIVLIGHSFGGLVLKSLVVKLKRKSTIGNCTDSWLKATVQRANAFLSNGILVNFSSAQELARAHSYMVEDANQMEVCKPPSKEHPSYKLLLQFIITCGNVARECDEALQQVHDLPQSMFGLESYVESVETLVTSEVIQLLNMCEYGAWVELGKLFFKDCCEAQR